MGRWVVLSSAGQRPHSSESRGKKERAQRVKSRRPFLSFILRTFVKNFAQLQLSLIKLIDILYRIEEEEIGRSRCKNLLITITKNTAIDHLRKASHAPIPFETVEKPDTSRSAEDLYIETEDYKKLIQCIDKLDEKYTEVLRLRLLHHLSARETAKILNISEFNVNTRLLRAKRLLAELLREVLK